MIWIILFFIIILVSAVLAFRSMKDYEEFPDSIALNSLFYIGNPRAFNSEVFSKLHKLFLPKKQFFSIESLNKGPDKALAIFGPVELPQIFPELKLVEIEDYLAGQGSEWAKDQEKKVSVNQTLTWIISPKTRGNIAQTNWGKNKPDIKENQKIFLQAVCIPDIVSGKNDFQCTLRMMVVDADPMERITLAKKTFKEFETQTGLQKLEDGYPEQKKFDSFKQRSLVPKEVAPFVLSEKDLEVLFT